MEMIKESKNVEFDVLYDDGTRKRVKEGVLHELEKEESAEKRAVFRLGQMDMRESVIAMLEDRKKEAAPFVRLTLDSVIQEARRLGGRDYGE